MTQEPLQGQQGDAFLNGRGRESVAQDMRGHGPADMSAIGHALDQALDGAGRHAQGVVQGEMPLQEWLEARRQGNDSPLGLGAVGTALAIDHKAVAWPI